MSFKKSKNNYLDFSSCSSHYMTMRYDPAKELSKSDAAVLVREIVENGTLILTRHVRERMQERGYSIQDVQFILTHGRVESSGFDEITGNWKYRFHGDDLDGGTGTVIVAIALQHKAIVITVLG